MPRQGNTWENGLNYDPSQGFANMSDAANKQYLDQQAAQAAAQKANEARVGGQYNQATGDWTGVDPTTFKYDPNSTANFNQQATKGGVQAENLNAFAQAWGKHNQNETYTHSGPATPPPAPAPAPKPEAPPVLPPASTGGAPGGAGSDVGLGGTPPPPPDTASLQGLRMAAGGGASDGGGGGMAQELSPTGLRQGLGTRIPPQYSATLAGLRSAY